MIELKTSSGFAVALDDKVLDNVELWEELQALEDGSVIAVGKVARMFLGAEGKKALYDHVRTEDGRVPAEALSVELNELFNSYTAAKNS